jgi:hypothetical protein
MKNGNNNSPPPYLIEYWLKGLLNEGTSVKMKKNTTNKNKSKKPESTKTDDDEDNNSTCKLEDIFYLMINLWFSLWCRKN